jgi:methylmalonyl-CoA mutase
MGDFPKADFAAWQARAAAVLKGDGNLDKLVTRSADGFALAPLYQQRQGPRAERASLAPWTIMQRVDHPRATNANAQVLTDLDGGATGLCLVQAGKETARGFGLADPAQMSVVLRGVALHAIALRLEGDADLARAFAAYVATQPIDPARLAVSFALDDAALLPALQAQGFRGPFFCCDGRGAHDAGASEAQELAAVLAQAVARLRALARAGAENPAGLLSVTLSACQDMFMTLAKFRAMRLLWARIMEASGFGAVPLSLHGETSWRMMARLDPHTNILRATAALFGAGVGGCDSFCILPFSLRQGLPNAFARRVARNQQHVLLDESHLWRVSDPASGSGYVESLTEELCVAAWLIFQDIEKSGRLPAFNSAATFNVPVIGTTAYPLAQEYEAAVETLS